MKTTFAVLSLVLAISACRASRTALALPPDHPASVSAREAPPLAASTTLADEPAPAPHEHAGHGGHR